MALEKKDLQVGDVLVSNYEYRVVVATNFGSIAPSVTVIVLGVAGHDGRDTSNEPHKMFLPIEYSKKITREEARAEFPKRWRKVTDLFPDIDK